MVLAGDVLSSRGGPIVSAWKTTLVVECHLERCLRLPCVIICILSHLSIIILLPVDYANFGSRVHLCIYTKRSVWCTVYVMLKNSYDTEFQPKLLQDTYSIRLREKSPWIYYSMLTLTAFLWLVLLGLQIFPILYRKTFKVFSSVGALLHVDSFTKDERCWFRGTATRGVCQHDAVFWDGGNKGCWLGSPRTKIPQTEPCSAKDQSPAPVRLWISQKNMP